MPWPHGKGTLLIARPRDVDALVRRVHKGRLATVNQIRERLAADAGADATCPMTTGSFLRIVAEVAEEDLRAGKKRVAPYWRVLRARGALNPRYPGGVERQARRRLREAPLARSVAAVPADPSPRYLSRMVTQQEREKQLAAIEAVRRVEDGMRLGLGSGSTAAIAVRLLGERVKKGLHITGVPTSRETARIAREVGIELDDLTREPTVDLTIDGADEVDGELQLVKGGGGALLREKIVASASTRMVVVVDRSKMVDRLGAFPLPVEVIPYAGSVVAMRLGALGVEPRVRRTPDGTPFVTDEGNYILDCPFGAYDDPLGLAAKLCTITGVVEHGLFLSHADEVIVADGEQVRVLTRYGGT